MAKKKDIISNVVEICPYSDSELIEIRDACLSNLSSKESVYNELRSYLFDNESKNPLYKHLKDIASLIYLPDNILFDIIVNPLEKAKGINEVADTLVKVLSEEFVNDGLDRAISKWIFWSLVYGFRIVKCVASGNNIKFVDVSPYDFAVYYEDNSELDRNQIMFQVARIPYKMAQKKYPDAVLPEVSAPIRGFQYPQFYYSKTDTDVIALPQPPDALKILRGEPVEDTAMRLSQTAKYAEIYEMWLYSDLIDDWIMVQFAGDKIIKSRNPFIRYHHPFAKLCVNEIEGYFYGLSEIYYLKRIFDGLKEQEKALSKLENQLLYPPMVVYGLSGSIEAQEIWKKLMGETSDKVVQIIDPTSKFDFYLPKLDPAFAKTMLEYYEQALKEQSGIMGVLSGKPTPGVRSASYANILAQFASTPLKEKALEVEAFIEQIMTLYAYFLCYTREEFKALAGYDFRIDVFAHTSSPITAMVYQDMMLTLANIGVFPVDALIDLLPVPKKEKIKEYAKQKQMMEMMQNVKAQEEQKKASQA